jgi:hypothetical protein
MPAPFPLRKPPSELTESQKAVHGHLRPEQPPPTPTLLFQALRQISDEILPVLNANRDPYQSFGNA